MALSHCLQLRLGFLALVVGMTATTTTLVAAKSGGIHFNYHSFGGSTAGLVLQGNASISSADGGPAIWLTPDPTNSAGGQFTNLIGRVVYRAPVEPTSFRTRFTFRLATAPAAYGRAGDGLAFFVAPAAADGSIPPIPSGSEGEFLGITSRWLPPARRRFFAVEFDTFNNSYDPPSASHVGIDVNSLESVATADTSDPASPFYLYGGYVLQAWIEYDNVAPDDGGDGDGRPRVRVWLDNCGGAGAGARCPSQSPTSRRPRVPPLLESDGCDLRHVFPRGGHVAAYVGLSAANGLYVEGAAVYSWDFDAAF